MDRSQNGGQILADSFSPSIFDTDLSIRIKVMDVVFVLGSFLLCLIARSYLKRTIRTGTYAKHREDISPSSYWSFLGFSQKLQVLLHKNIPSVTGDDVDVADRNFPSLCDFQKQYPSYGYDGEIDVLAADFPNRSNEHYLDHAGATLYSISQVTI
jgi:hypothetical protein